MLSVVFIYHTQHAKLELKLRSPREIQDVRGKSASYQ